MFFTSRYDEKTMSCYVRTYTTLPVYFEISQIPSIHPSIWHDAMIWKRAKPIGLRTYVDPREVEWILMHELRICTAVPI